MPTTLTFARTDITGEKLEQELLTAGLPSPLSVYLSGGDTVIAWPSATLTAPQQAQATTVVAAHTRTPPRTGRAIADTAQDVMAWIASGADPAERQVRLARVASLAIACAAQTHPGLLRRLGVPVDNDGPGV